MLGSLPSIINHVDIFYRLFQLSTLKQLPVTVDTRTRVNLSTPVGVDVTGYILTHKSHRPHSTHTFSDCVLFSSDLLRTAKQAMPQAHRFQELCYITPQIT